MKPIRELGKWESKIVLISRLSHCRVTSSIQLIGDEVHIFTVYQHSYGFTSERETYLPISEFESYISLKLQSGYHCL